MSVESEPVIYSGYPGPFLSVEDRGLQERGTNPATPLETELQAKKIATIALSVVEADFLELSRDFNECIDDPASADVLLQTYHMVDRRYGHTAGYFRKERKRNDAGIQIEDPKHVFQFNEQAREHWRRQFTNDAPAILLNFLEKGYEIHTELLKSGRTALADIDESYPGVLEEHFPTDGSSVSFM